MSSNSIDLSNDLSYEYLSMLISEFEEAALKSNKRAGILAVANGSTYAADVVIDAHEKSLNRVNTIREKFKDKELGKTPAVQLVDKDLDLMALLDSEDSKFANYIEECLNCNLRLKFDWQLKPIAFLGPVYNFLDKINASIDSFSARLDPMGNLSDICIALNQLKPICVQDLVIVLMSLKMLMKKYTLQMFNIKLDWTTMLGPLLNAIVSGLTDLLDNIFALLMAPLDCTLTSIKSSNALLKEGISFTQQAKTTGKGIGDFFGDISKKDSRSELVDRIYDSTVQDISWDTAQESATTLGAIDSDTVTNPKRNPKPENSLRVPTGFILKNGMGLDNALADPNFNNSTFLEKLIVPVDEAIEWIKETYNKFIGSLRSLSELVGGGFEFSLSRLGALLFLIDLISIVMMIIQLLSSNKKVNDWCTLIGENPQLLEQALRQQYGNTIRVNRIAGISNGDQVELAIVKGPETVGIVKACLNKRTDVDSATINQWVRDIEMRSSR